MMRLRPDYRNSDVIDNKRNYSGTVSTAKTEYRVLEAKGNASLVLVKPHTGVKHQIRAHLGFGLGTPILGDHKFSDIRQTGKPQRVHGDILIRLGVRRSRARDLPVYLHSKKLFLPGAELTGGERHTLAIDTGLPNHFNKTMQKLKLSPKELIQ